MGSSYKQIAVAALMLAYLGLPLYVLVFVVGQISRVRRLLFSTFLLEHMRALMRLGLPLARGLDACSGQLGPHSARDLENVQEGLSRGELLGDALGRVPFGGVSLFVLVFRFLSFVLARPVARLVTPAEAEVLRIGERSGGLSEAVDLVLDERQRYEEIRSMLRNDLLYPLFLIVTVGAVATGIMTFIMPRMVRMLSDMGMDESFGLAASFAAFPIMKIGGWGIFCAAMAVLIWRFSLHGRPVANEDAPMRDGFRRLLYSVPLVRGALRAAFLIEFCRELGLLLRVETPLPQALEALCEGR